MSIQTQMMRTSPGIHGLPVEVRHQIWDLVFGWPSAFTCFPPVDKIYRREYLHSAGKDTRAAHETVLAIARTCKALYDETVAHYYTRRLGFKTIRDLYRYLHEIGSSRRQFIQNIQVYFASSYPVEAFTLMRECTMLKSLWILVSIETVRYNDVGNDDLWCALGVEELKKVLDLPILDLRVREVLMPYPNPQSISDGVWAHHTVFDNTWQEYLATRLELIRLHKDKLPFHLRSKPLPFTWTSSAFEDGQVAEFERGLRLELARKHANHHQKDLEPGTSKV